MIQPGLRRKLSTSINTNALGKHDGDLIRSAANAIQAHSLDLLELASKFVVRLPWAVQTEGEVRRTLGLLVAALTLATTVFWAMMLTHLSKTEAETAAGLYINDVPASASKDAPIQDTDVMISSSYVNGVAAGETP